MIELPTIPGYGNGVGSFGSSRYLPSLDLAFAEDKAFTVNTASPGNASITSRRGPSANFLRQSGATYINDQGLIEYAPENLVTHSENPSNVNWYKIDSIVVTLTTDPTPTGSLNAYKIDATSSSNGIITSAGSQPVGASTVTGSVWLKASNPIPFNTFICLRNELGSLILEQSITITSEWQRFSITGNIGSNTIVRVGVGGNNTFNYGKSFYIWGAQIERHSSARTYLPTTTSPFYGPRFDHDPITKVCRGLFIEGTSTNLLLRSEEFNLSSWVSERATPELFSVVSPNGLTNTTRLKEDTTESSSHRCFQSVSISLGTYTFSVFVKRGGRDWVRLTLFDGTSKSVWFNLDTGVVGTQTGGTGVMTSIGNGWWRCSITAALAATVIQTQIALSTGDNINIYSGNGIFSIFLWGAQLEVGSTSSSYIPTTNGTVLRSADISSITGNDFTSFYNRIEGTLFVDTTPRIGNQLAWVVAVNTLSFADSHFIGKSDSSSTTGNQWIGGTVNGINLQSSIVSPLDTASIRSKLIYSYKTNDMAFASNNILIGTDTTGVMPTPTALRIGSRGDSLFINGHIARVTYYRRRLPNRNLQLLTRL